MLIVEKKKWISFALIIVGALLITLYFKITRNLLKSNIAFGFTANTENNWSLTSKRLKYFHNTTNNDIALSSRTLITNTANQTIPEGLGKLRKIFFNATNEEVALSSQPLINNKMDNQTWPAQVEMLSIIFSNTTNKDIALFSPLLINKRSNQTPPGLQKKLNEFFSNATKEDVTFFSPTLPFPTLITNVGNVTLSEVHEKLNKSFSNATNESIAFSSSTQPFPTLISKVSNLTLPEVHEKLNKSFSNTTSESVLSLTTPVSKAGNLILSEIYEKLKRYFSNASNEGAASFSTTPITKTDNLLLSEMHEMLKQYFSNANEDSVLSSTTPIAKAGNLLLSEIYEKLKKYLSNATNKGIKLSSPTPITKLGNQTVSGVHEKLKNSFYNSTNEGMGLHLPTFITKPIKQTHNMFNQTELTIENSSSKNLTTNEMLKVALRKAQEKEYIIIIWDLPFGVKENLGMNSENCGKCTVSDDRTKWNDPSTKAIIFHFRELNTANWPNKRRKDVYYVWWALESPLTVRFLYGKTLRKFNGVFNLTMSYRRDADVYSPYNLSSMIWEKFQHSESGNPSKDVDDLMRNKTKLAIWIVSNCKLTSGSKNRWVYVNKLVNAGLNLDRRGRCFPGYGFIRNKEIIKQYKFYLSFENSFHCKDYITEKLFYNGLEMGAVPVVYGARKSDCEAVVPPGSCIYVEDFKSPKQLVEYLNYLDGNTTAYRQYFKWRTMEKEDIPQYNRTSGYCNLCRILHGINVDNIHNPPLNNSNSNIPMFGYPEHPRIVPSLREWYYRIENPTCIQYY